MTDRKLSLRTLSISFAVLGLLSAGALFVNTAPTPLTIDPPLSSTGTSITSNA